MMPSGGDLVASAQKAFGVGWRDDPEQVVVAQDHAHRHDAVVAKGEGAGPAVEFVGGSW